MIHSTTRITTSHLLGTSDHGWIPEGVQTLTSVALAFQGGTCLRVFHSLDWAQARRDVQRFVKPHELPSLELWTRDFFHQQCRRLGLSGGAARARA